MITGVIGGVFFYCGNPIAPLLYVPEVTFTGYFNNVYDSLAGNREWPNRCTLIGDTIRIFCYSTSFSEVNSVRQGDLLRIDLYPDSGDDFEKRNTLFHLARYHGQNESYTINRGDTGTITIQFESKIVAYSRVVGADLEIREIFIATPPLSLGQNLEIKKGHLFGSVHRK